MTLEIASSHLLGFSVPLDLDDVLQGRVCPGLGGLRFCLPVSFWCGYLHRFARVRDELVFGIDSCKVVRPWILYKVRLPYCVICIVSLVIVRLCDMWARVSFSCCMPCVVWLLRVVRVTSTLLPALWCFSRRFVDAASALSVVLRRSCFVSFCGA